MARFSRRIFTFMILAALSSIYKCTKDINNYLGYTYRSNESNNTQTFLDALGVGAYDEEEPFFDVLRKKGKEYIYTSNHTEDHVTFSFKPNEEFMYETMFGRFVQSNISIVGATLFERQQDLKGNIVHIIRRFSAKTLTVIMKLGEITATRFYKSTQPGNCSCEEETEERSTGEETDPSCEH